MAASERFAEDLLQDLLTFRVETLVLERPVNGRVVREEVRRPAPPSDPLQLMAEVVDASTRWVRNASTGFADVGDRAPPWNGSSEELLALAEEADRLATSARRVTAESRQLPAETIDPEVAARTGDALRLVASIRASNGTFRQDVDRRAAAVQAVDHRTMRRLARFWELGDRSVWCRTTMRLDGDIATILRVHAPESKPIETAHTTLVLAAMGHWELLILAVGTAVQLVGGLVAGPRRWIRRRPRRLPKSSAPFLLAAAKTPGPRELIRRVIRLLSLGRVVFESPAPGSSAEVRTMVLASGDIETSIRAHGVAEGLLVAHIESVTRWLAELEAGFRRWRSILAIVPAVIVTASALPTFVGDLTPSVSALRGLILRTLVIGVAARIGRVTVRRWIRRKLTQLVGHAQDDVEVAGS